MHTHSSSQQLCLHTQFDATSCQPAVYGCDSEFTPLCRHLFSAWDHAPRFPHSKGSNRRREREWRSCVEFVISCEGKSGDGESTTNAQKRNRAFEINLVGWMKRKKIFESVSFLVFISSTKHGAEKDMQESWGIVCGLNIAYYCWKVIG